MFKKYFPLLIITSLFLLFYSYQNVSGSQKFDDLIEIVKVTKENGITIKSWVLHTKKDAFYANNEREVIEIINQVKLKENDYKWSNETNKTYHKEIGFKWNKDYNLKERIVIVSYIQNDKYYVSVTYQLEGEGWDNDILEELPLDSKAPVYYTVKGSMQPVNDKGIEEIARDLISFFSAEITEGIIEKDLVALSAFNKNWDLYLSTGKSEKMNLQVGVRESNDKVLVTIGTPIITTEY